MKKNPLKEKAKELFVQGMEAVDIIKELEGEVSQSTVYRWYDEFEKRNLEVQTTTQNTEDPQEGLSDLTLSTNESPKKLNNTQRNFDDSQPPSANSPLSETEIKQQELREAQLVTDLRKKKRTVIRLFKRLLRRMLEFSGGSTRYDRRYLSI